MSAIDWVYILALAGSLALAVGVMCVILLAM
jgi:hypothetical protein